MKEKSFFSGLIGLAGALSVLLMNVTDSNAQTFPEPLDGRVRLAPLDSGQQACSDFSEAGATETVSFSASAQVSCDHDLSELEKDIYCKAACKQEQEEKGVAVFSPNSFPYSSDSECSSNPHCEEGPRSYEVLMDADIKGHYVFSFDIPDSTSSEECQLDCSCSTKATVKYRCETKESLPGGEVEPSEPQCDGRLTFAQCYKADPFGNPLFPPQRGDISLAYCTEDPDDYGFGGLKIYQEPSDMRPPYLDPDIEGQGYTTFIGSSEPPYGFPGPNFEPFMLGIAIDWFEEGPYSYNPGARHRIGMEICFWLNF